MFIILTLAPSHFHLSPRLEQWTLNSPFCFQLWPSFRVSMTPTIIPTISVSYMELLNGFPFHSLRSKFIFSVRFKRILAHAYRSTSFLPPSLQNIQLPWPSWWNSNLVSDLKTLCSVFILHKKIIFEPLLSWILVSHPSVQRPPLQRSLP
jgi:hypothetical protein